MNAELTTVQHLVNALDDARSLYEKAVDEVVDPRLRDLLECAIGRHWLIADDLARQVVETGGEVTRDGSRLGRLRAFLTEKFAQLSVDIDAAYANQAVKREVALLRDFRQAVASICNVRLCNHLQIHCRRIESAATETRCLRTSLDLQADVQTRAGYRDRAGSVHASRRPTVMGNSHHSNA